MYIVYNVHTFSESTVRGYGATHFLLILQVLAMSRGACWESLMVNYVPMLEQKKTMRKGIFSSCCHLWLTGDRRQTKQFCFLDADCLVVGKSQSSSRRSAGKYPVKPPRSEGDSQTIDTYMYHCRNTSIGFSIIDIFC